MVKTGLGWPMGVFELFDDISMFRIILPLPRHLSETCGYAMPPLARQALQAGFLGDLKLKARSKGGWYDYLGVPR